MRKYLLVTAVLSVLACSKGALESSNDEELVPQSDASATPTVPPPLPPSNPANADAGSEVPATKNEDASTPMPTMACVGGAPEAEPNDATAKASPLVTGKNCGSVGPGDVDFFVLTLNGSGMIRFEAASDDVRFFLVDESGAGDDFELFAGDAIDVNGTSAKEFFRVESTSKQGYTITRQ